MKSRSLIFGCFGAVVILILSVYSTIIGVAEEQNLNSNSQKDSPLFHVQTQQNLHSKLDILISTNYLGKGTINLIGLPAIDNSLTLLQKAMDRIRGMTDEEYKIEIHRIVNKLMEKNIISEDQIPEFIQALYKIKDTPNILLNIQQTEKENIKQTSLITVGNPLMCLTMLPTPAICDLMVLVRAFLFFIALPIILITVFLCFI